MNTEKAINTEIVEPSAVEAIERANTDIQIATAKKYPRVLSKVKADMLTFATLDEETAESCFYTLPRGGKEIQGPSVRLAEIAVWAYGNLRAGARPIHVQAHGDNPHVVVQAVAHDLERNTLITIEKRRRILKKRGRETVDEDDIMLAVNACASIAFRDAVFKVVPLSLIKPVYEAARKVAIGDASSLASKRAKVIDRLKKMGATEDRILAAVGARTIEDIDGDKLGTLIGIGTALKEGEIKLEEAFPAPVKMAEVAAATPFKKKDQPAPAQPEPNAPEEQATSSASGEPPAKDQVLIFMAEADINPVAFESYLRKKGVLPSVATLTSMSTKVAEAILNDWKNLVNGFLASQNTGDKANA
jgi:hypothetical protein